MISDTLFNLMLEAGYTEFPSPLAEKLSEQANLTTPEDVKNFILQEKKLIQIGDSIPFEVRPEDPAERREMALKILQEECDA